MATMAQALPSTSREITNAKPPDRQEVLEMLKTPYLYKLSPDGNTYSWPRMLCGTPVEKINESCEYWVRSWDSLDGYLAQQEPEARRKQELEGLLAVDRSNEALRRYHKKYSDNSSKFIKIREIFGEASNYHPNQLVSKQHLPARGLCQKELLYRLACKISDLQQLQKQGYLAMDPWDFIRWRIMRKATERVPYGSAKDCIRTIIYKLCDAGNDISARNYQDPLMRGAVLLAAELTNHVSSYGSKKNRKNDGSNAIRPARYNRQPREGVLTRPRAKSGYRGVNDYRAKQQHRHGHDSGC